MNVWRYGLTRVGLTGAVTLAARLLDPFEGILTNNRGFFTGLNPVIYLLPGEGLPDIYLPFPAFPSAPHFPYGYEVEPD